MSDCIFCKIAGGEIPAKMVYDEDGVCAFWDMNPKAPVHLLVIPKEHIASAAEVTADNSHLVAKCFEAIAKIAEREGLDEGFRIISNCGEDAGQTVFHLHFHILAGVPLGERLI